MVSEIINNSEYKFFIVTIKSQIQSAQIKAAVLVNRELLHLYWFIAEQIVQKQKNARWGDGLVKQISHDLQQDFPDIKGFSTRNIHLMKQWYLYWYKEVSIVQQAVAQLEKSPIFQIPWGQNLLIISKAKSSEEALFYVQKTIENNWSRAVLTHQIESELYQRQGKALSNFDSHLPTPQLPESLQSSLPSIEEIEAEIGGVFDE
jgi:predicted nuclease of restriction endonuclease-like (RecB) superfamily